MKGSRIICGYFFLTPGTCLEFILSLSKGSIFFLGKKKDAVLIRAVYDRDLKL